MALTELKVKNLKPKDKRYLVNDGQGLYIAVMPSGEKYWYYRTREDGRDLKHSLGRYPDVSLKQARELRYTLKNPQKVPAVPFGPVLEEWFTARCLPTCSESVVRQTRSRIDRFILPALAHRNIREITAREVFELVRPINEKYATTGQSVQSIISRVFRYAIASGLCEWDPAAQLSGALTPYRVTRHRSTIQTETQAHDVLLKIDAYGGSPVFRLALLLLAYTFVRPSELRLAQWPELDFDKAEWHIPAERMKMRREHVIPLSPQALSLFQKLRGVVTHPLWCFALPFKDKPVGRGMLPYVMCRLGLKDIATPHSFRGMASTLLNEHGFMPDVIERQLAHAPGNAVRAAYNRAEYLDDRRRMMDWWGSYLDGLRTK